MRGLKVEVKEEVLEVKVKEEEEEVPVAAPAPDPAERYSPAGLQRLRAELEGLRAGLVSAPVRENERRKRRVTVGRTPLGECLRQLREARAEWEKEAAAAAALIVVPEETQRSLLNRLEKGLALIDRIQELREKPPRRRAAAEAAAEKRARLLNPGAAQRGGRGVVPPRGNPRRAQRQPWPPLPLAPEEIRPEEEGGEAWGARKKEAAVAAQQPGGEGEGQDSGGEEDSEEEEEDSEDDEDDDSHEDGSDGDSDSEDWVEGSDEDGGGGDLDSDGDAWAEGSDEDGGGGGDSESDGDDWAEGSNGEDSDEGEGSRALWAEVTQLEQEVDTVQDVSQEKLGALNLRVRCLSSDLSLFTSKRRTVLKKKMIHVWGSLLEKPLGAVAALKAAVDGFWPEGMSALKKECDALCRFLQDIWSHKKIDSMIDFQYVVNDFLYDKWDFPLEVDGVKKEIGTWCSGVLRVLLKQGQEKVDALQEKVDAVQSISVEQGGELKEKMGIVRKQVGVLWKVPLEELIALQKMINKLSSMYSWHNFKKKHVNTMWLKVRVLILRIKFGLRNAPPEEVEPLLKKLVALEAALCDVLLINPGLVEEKQAVLCGKRDTRQDELWNSLEAELQLLKEKAHFLREIDRLKEEPHGLEKKLDKLQKHPEYSLQEKVRTLQKKVGALQKPEAPPGAVDSVMKGDGSSFSETRKAGTEQVNVAAGGSTDQSAKTGAETARPSSFGATNLLRNADRCSDGIRNLRGSVSTSEPPSSTGLWKTWHEEVTQEERNRLVNNFEKTISPGNDSAAASTKLEAYVRQAEEDTFKQANSKHEYHHLMAEKPDAFRKKLDQNLSSPSRNQGVTGRAPLSAAGRRLLLGRKAAEAPSVAGWWWSTSPRRSERQNPERSEEGSHHSLDGCELTVAETAGSEPPHKKQKMDDGDGI